MRLGGHVALQIEQAIVEDSRYSRDSLMTLALRWSRFYGDSEINAKKDRVCEGKKPTAVLDVPLFLLN